MYIHTEVYCVLSEKVIFQVKAGQFCSLPRCHLVDYDPHVIRVFSFHSRFEGLIVILQCGVIASERTYPIRHCRPVPSILNKTHNERAGLNSFAMQTPIACYSIRGLSQLVLQ